LKTAVSRLFCRAIGLPPHLYLTQVRVLQAKKLLAQGWAIAQVAQEVGFSHQSHLNRHFKKIVGITPKQYQNSKNVQD
jgi:AraC-like DNA-binding protein